jgi:polysaccharide export outer membrane protein
MKCLVVILMLSGYVLAQNPTVPNPAAPTKDEGFSIAPDDVLEISVSGAPEFGGTPRVNATGYITLPFTGGFKAAGLNSNVLAKDIEDALLSKKYLVAPNVVVSIKERKEPAVGQASVLGAVKSPGVVPLKTPKALMDVLAFVGGPTENAGKTIQVFRKPAASEASASASAPVKDQVIEVSTEELFQRGNTDLNILIYPGDIINVLQTASIFVVGDVKNPGEFPLKFGKGITIRQAVALAGNFNPSAKKEESKIIRYHTDGTQDEIHLDLRKVMDASLGDPPLMPNDILFVPSSKAKNAFNKTLEVAIGVVTQRAIYIGR